MWHVGDVVRKLREGVSFTLSELSAVSGVNVQVIHRIEHGRTKRPTRRTIAKIAKVFDLHTNDLYAMIPQAIFVSFDDDDILAALHFRQLDLRRQRDQRQRDRRRPQKRKTPQPIP